MELLGAAARSAETLAAEEFLDVPEPRIRELRAMVKALYDAGRRTSSAADDEEKKKKKKRTKTAQSLMLPELLVDGFDEEQIWQQIALVNAPTSQKLSAQADALLRTSSAGDKDEEEEEDEAEETTPSAPAEEEEEEEEAEEEEDAMEEEEGKEEEKEEGGDDAMYADFFDPPQEGEFENPLDFAGDVLDRLERLDEDQDAAEEQQAMSSDDDQEEEEEEEEKPRKKTPHEERMERIQKKIAQLEDANIAERHWAHKGEVGVHDRPADSLLETAVEFQTATRPPPPPSKAAALELCELIRRRIATETFDDVERRDPDADAAASKPPSAHRIPLAEEQRRAQMSLAEIYEEEFRNRLLAAERKLQPASSASASASAAESDLTDEQKEVEAQFKRLCSKLDALANLHFAPKRVDRDAEVKVLPNVPALAMEEVVPVAVSRSSLLAPEEVYAQKHEAPAVREEMSRDERHTAHAQVKRRKRATLRAKPKTKEQREEEAAAAVVEKKRQRTKAAEAAKAVGSSQKRFRSRAFFSDLQQKADAGVPATKRAARESHAPSTASSAAAKL